MNDRWLKLEIGNKCGENAPNCICTGSTGNFTTSRDTDFDQVVGFVRYTHRSDEPFRLLKNIGDDEQLDVGDNYQEVKGVTEVSVYYWSENERKPLLLRVVKDGVTHEPEYYYKYGGNENEAGGQQNLWRHKNHEGGISLQTRLDERNLGINNRIPLYLDEPDKPLGLGSDLAKSVTIQHVQPPPPQLVGGGYTITEYKLNGDTNTSISRIEYGKQKVNVDIPPGGMNTVRLYSSPVNSNVPLMVNFNLKNGEPRWYFSKTQDGRSWIEVGSTDNFYKDDLPTENLAKNLDGFACKYHKAVTMDLTKDTFKGKKEKDCADGKSQNISVEQVEITGDSGRKTKYTKYSIKDREHKLVDLKFYHNGYEDQRRRIKSNSLNFPIQGPADIYTFYSSNTKDPVLIYVDASRSSGESQANTGWYRRSKNGYDSPWTKLRKQLRNITHQNFRELDCDNWNTLVGELKRGDSGLQECPQETAKQQDKQGQQRAEELRSGGEEAEETAKEEDVKASEDEQSDEEGSYTVLGAAGPKAVSSRDKDGPPGGNGLIGPNGDGGPAGGKPGAEDTPSEPAPFTSLITGGSAIAGYFFAGTAGSGLTGFLGYKGYKLYQNFKGDPWVRHRYSIEFLKNVPC
ncbi:hypothetical protein BEWA_028200 [Theileria equi strain WA]|uniref:Uncharacterized protein n=1 Tax=Theileria equi strain WA TaxID=1537102 RepID=L0AY90_THEEQ|nr:hypothetical protein BEWA_028200 [Theileria equi strain WA]AFZ79971.1 hypothetical protein BEWA_028200 [Theileria equi strain WA]|eukprot:XP_004829637.1 hypothetical protein BEWA_028200 [Theileria equi strain WA]